jgi:hypothetical protein
MLTIIGKEVGSCQVCMEPATVYEAKYKDGLKGKFCRKCALGLLDRRLDGKEGKHADGEGSGNETSPKLVQNVRAAG